LSQFTFFNGLGRSIVRQRFALLLFASRRSCLDRVDIDAGAETQPERENDRGIAMRKGPPLLTATASIHNRNARTNRPRAPSCSAAIRIAIEIICRRKVPF